MSSIVTRQRSRRAKVVEAEPPAERSAENEQEAKGAEEFIADDDKQPATEDDDSHAIGIWTVGANWWVFATAIMVMLVVAAAEWVDEQ